MVTRPAPPSIPHDHRTDTRVLPLPERRSVYLTILHEQLEIRAREHGHAYVTPREGAWLEANGLRQPGHTTHRFSTMEKDQSDAALGRLGNAS